MNKVLIVLSLLIIVLIVLTINKIINLKKDGFGFYEIKSDTVDSLQGIQIDSNSNRCIPVYKNISDESNIIMCSSLNAETCPDATTQVVLSQLENTCSARNANEIQCNKSSLGNCVLKKQNVFVGYNDADKDIFKYPKKINESVNLGTNNTLFIKDGIYISSNNGDDNDDQYLDIQKLRTIKYLPYHFDEKMCIGNSCINKHNIKMLKGKLPFTINTFTDLRPIQGFTEPGYKGYKMIFGIGPEARISINGDGLKSVKITDDNYNLTVYSEENFQGTSQELTKSNSDLSDDFPEGAKSMIPKSKKGNLIENTCLAGDEIYKQGGTTTGYFPIPCDSVKNSNTKYFYLLRDDVIDHSHDNDQIHFHEHSGLEELHD